MTPFLVNFELKNHAIKKLSNCFGKLVKLITFLVDLEIFDIDAKTYQFLFVFACSGTFSSSGICKAPFPAMHHQIEGGRRLYAWLPCPGCVRHARMAAYYTQGPLMDIPSVCQPCLQLEHDFRDPRKRPRPSVDTLHDPRKRPRPPNSPWSPRREDSPMRSDSVIDS